MFEPIMEPENRRQFLLSVLERDPDDIWAMLSVAQQAESSFERTLFLREAARVGEYIWDLRIDQKEPPPDWVKNEEALQFFTAVRLYGLELAKRGHQNEASECLALSLQLDPDDRLEVAEAYGALGVEIRRGMEIKLG